MKFTTIAILALLASACATTAPATTASPTASSTTSADEVVRIREENARLRRLHQLEVEARAQQGQQPAPTALAQQTTRPVAPPPPAMAIPALPPLCPGVDPSFGMIPPGLMAVTETMGVSRGGRIAMDANANDVWVNMPPAFYVSADINGRVMSQFAGTSGTPTMLVVRHPATQALCRMPAVSGPTTTIRFVPESFDDGQELTVHVWYAPTDATGPRVARHTSQCAKDPRASHSVVGVNSSGRCS